MANPKVPKQKTASEQASQEMEKGATKWIAEYLKNLFIYLFMGYDGVVYSCSVAVIDIIMFFTTFCLALSFYCLFCGGPII